VVVAGAAAVAEAGVAAHTVVVHQQAPVWTVVSEILRVVRVVVLTMA
jgi:hypothetical protein